MNTMILLQQRNHNPVYARFVVRTYGLVCSAPSPAIKQTATTTQTEFSLSPSHAKDDDRREG